MDYQNWIALIAVLNPIILFVLGILFNRKINKKDKELIERDAERVKGEKIRESQLKEFILDTLDTVQIKLVDIEMAFTTLADKIDFKTEFRSKISNKSAQILIHLSEFLTQEQKNILNYWGNIIEEFGTKFFDNIKRKGRKKTLSSYLSQEMEICIRDFDNYVDSIYGEIRIYNKEKVFFSQFIDKVKLHSRSEQLKMRCVANNFKDNDEIIEIFIEYIEDFYADFTSGIRAWNLLSIYEKKENAA